MMPELPEVETIRRALRPHLIGHRIVGVRTFVPALRYPLQLDDRPELIGARIGDVRRRGRYLLVELERSQVLLLHLGMSGACRIVPAARERKRHEHVVFELDNGASWRFSDPRRFGFIQVHAIAGAGELPACLGGLGPEPLGKAFSGEWLRQYCQGRRRPIKPLLMENACVTGVGNIYASEALYRARLHPRTAAGRLSLARCVRLVRAVKAVLEAAIAAGGTTIAQFRSVNGREGRFARQLDVYGRAGEVCRRCCRGRVKRIVQSGRSTYYCGCCQHV